MDEYDILHIMQLLLFGNIVWVWFFIGHPLTKRRHASWFIMITGILPGLFLSWGTFFFNYTAPLSSFLVMGSLFLWGILRKSLL